MRAALFYGGPDIRVEERPRPEPGPGEVLVRVRSAGICGSDLHGYRAATPGSGAPRENGHELAGEVVALGPGVTGMAVGARVGIEPEHLVGCGRCDYCRRGDSHLCPGRGQGRASHGFSQYDVCLAANVHPLPEQVPLDAAAILDCYACAVHAVHRAPPTPASLVTVLGTGAIGMTLGQVARASGARRVRMVGTREQPLAIARAAGAADETLLGDKVAALAAATAAGAGDDVVYETVGGAAPTFDQAVHLARPGGAVCVLGIFAGRQELDMRAAYRKELTITWSNSYATWNGRSEYAIALDLLAAGRVDPAPLLTHHYPLERIGEAFAAAADKPLSGAIKLLVHP